MRTLSIPVDLENNLLNFSDAEAICTEVERELQIRRGRLVVTIEGAPGTGKTVFTKMMGNALAQRGIPQTTFSVDWGVLPRTERRVGSDVISWTRPDLTEETLTNPGIRFTTWGFEAHTSKRSKRVEIVSPTEGVLLVDGMRGLEIARETLDETIIAIHLKAPTEIREKRIAARNVPMGRWKLGEVETRLAGQRATLIEYYREVTRDLEKSSHKNPLAIRRLKKSR